MTLTRFAPCSIVDLMEGDLKRFPTQRFKLNGDDRPASDWAPAVDIVEEKARFVLRADVPGVAPDDIEISMDAGVLSVAGERNVDTASQEADPRRVERVSGRFFRRFSLPESADASGITAKSSNGILEVAIPKLPAVQARRIAVEAA
jgi:HSP20 family protein